MKPKDVIRTTQYVSPLSREGDRQWLNYRIWRMKQDAIEYRRKKEQEEELAKVFEPVVKLLGVIILILFCLFVFSAPFILLFDLFDIWGF